MTPNPTDQDVAALVAEPVAWASEGQMAALADRPNDEGGVYIPLRKTPIGQFQMPLYDAAILSALAAERDDWMRQAAAERDMRRWNIDETPDGLVICRGDHDKGEDCEHERWVPAERAEASEARATALEAERDGWKEAARRAGVCMSCAVGLPPETYGCTDCLNTGWIGGAPAGFVTEAHVTTIEAQRSDFERMAETYSARAGRAEAQLARAREALGQASTALANSVPVWPDVERAVQEALRSLPAPADGRGEDDGVASASQFGSPPNGYHPLPAGEACRCIKLWRDNKGNHWCCRPVEIQLDQEEVALNAWARATGAHNPWSRGYWPGDKEAARKGVRAVIAALSAPPEGTGRSLADANQKITQTGDRDE